MDTKHLIYNVAVVLIAALLAGFLYYISHEWWSLLGLLLAVAGKGFKNG